MQPLFFSAQAKDGEDRNGFWKESFKGTEDTKPHGPSSIGLDITFQGAKYPPPPVRV